MTLPRLSRLALLTAEAEVAALQDRARFACRYCGEDTTECRRAAATGAPCGA